TLTANAADADGTVSSVEFFNGGTLLGTDTSAPYSFAWANVPAGSYSLTAKATDNLGAVTTSAAVSVTVNSGGGGTCTVAAWQAATVYVGTNQASRNGNLYAAKWWTQGDDPATTSCPDCVWRLVGPCGNARATAPTAASTELTLYPNPVTDRLQINSTASLTGSRFEVLNSWGQAVLKGFGTDGRIDVAGLRAGVYTLKLTYEGKTQVIRRFVK
ncbi:MAG: T9SS type A sorting domain-containing protein, partial [Hymenobacter sp.]|nr:T9SS type A sorting domain-containing protein [Hymenobacter sp.]